MGPPLDAPVSDVHDSNLVIEKESPTESKSLNGLSSQEEVLTRHTSAASEADSYPEGGKEAWLVTFGSFCAVFASLAMMNSVGTFQAWISDHELKDTSVEKISWMFGFYSFLTFFAGLQWGPVFDAYGPRVLSVCGSILLLLMYGIMGLCQEFWQFFLVIGLVGGFATGLIFTPAIGSVQHWFYARRGIATGLAVSGGSVAGIIFPLFLQALLPRIGFAWATRAAGLMLLPFLTAACLLMKSRVVDHGRRGPALPDITMFKKPMVPQMVIGVFTMELAFFVPVAYLPSYALDKGMSVKSANALLTYLNVGSLVGRWLPGYMSDKIGRFNSSILAFIICIISMLGLWLSAGSNEGLLVATAVLFGLGSGSNISLTPVCLGQLCKTSEYGRFYTSIYTVASFGSLLGIPIAGTILSGTNNNYRGLIIFGGVSYAVALVGFIAVRIQSVGWRIRVKF